MRSHVSYSLIVEMLYFFKFIFSTAEHRSEKSKRLMTTEGLGHTKIVNVFFGIVPKFSQMSNELNHV